MTNKFAVSASRVRFAWFQQHLIVALCGVALVTLFPHRSSAQQVTYYDFNTPEAATPSQTSTNCGTIPGGPVANGVLFCFNYSGAGLSYLQDFYPPIIDPNASTDGDAGSTDYALQVTENAGSQASSMWFSIPQDVVDGFTAWYTVKINHQADDPSNYFTADGLAFVIQNAAGGAPVDPITGCKETGSGFTVLGGSGGCIGYGGIDNSVALEMDTFWNAPYDPEQTSQGWMYDDNHMALQSCGPGNPNSISHLTTPNCLISLNGTSTLVTNLNASLVPSLTPVPVTLADGNPHQVVIVYNGPNDSPANYIYVYLDPAFNAGTHTPVAGSVPLFMGPFNITNSINLNNGTAYVGFTSATGGDWEQHEVMAWSFASHGYQQDFGNVNVCSSGQTSPAPCSNTLPVTFNFAATTTIGSVKVVTQGTTDLDFRPASGSTCSGAISVGNSCTVNVKFAPRAPGLRLGAVELFDNSGNLLVTRLVYGIGQGAAIAFGPGTQTSVSTGSYSLNQPKGLAVDAAGDLFIADTGNQRVVKVAANGTQTTVGVGLEFPQGLAVDGAGDLFIADNNLNEVVKVPAGCTNSGCQTTVGFGLAAQLGVAVDGAGDLFIGDFTGNQVVELPAGCTSSACQIVVYSQGSGSNPVGLAVDAAGDLFIADFGRGKVVEIPHGCTTSSCQTTVGTGWDEPESVSVDAAGDLFVADAGLDALIEVPAGCTSSSCQSTVVSGIESFGATVDAAGDLFIADANNDRVVEMNRSQPPSLSFAATNVGFTSSDSPQSFTIQNVGNQALDAVSPGLAVNGPNFVEVAGSGTPADCSATFALTQGGACNLSISFEPQSGGNPLTSTAVFTDNALNAAPATQTVALSGNGLLINYLLTVSEVGLGSGTVTSSPGPISCSEAGGSVSGTCSTSYQSGTPVTLTANAAGTSTFSGWGGDCASAGTNLTCNVVMSLALNVTASFDQQNFGNVNVCPPGQTIPAPCSNTLALTYNIAADTTIGVIQVVTQGVAGLDFTLGSGSTCTGNISAGNSCTVNVTFAPLAPGLRLGAVRFFDNTGNLLAATPVYGIGQGPAIAFGPGTQITVSTGSYSLNSPQGVAVDAAGDLFVADTGNNRVVEVPAGGTPTLVNTGTYTLSGPFGLAVDGAGDLFVADYNNARVVEVPTGGTPALVNTGTYTVSGPKGLAVDGAGDLFIASSLNGQVIEVPAGGGTPALVNTGSYTLTQPSSVAVDGAGDVFIADQTKNEVVEVPAGGTPALVSTGSYVLNFPQGVAVDAAGDILIADARNSRVLEVTPSSGQSIVESIGTGQPYGIAVDGTGDVFTASTVTNQVSELARFVPPSLSFALTNVGSTSADSPQLVSVQNAGNQPLTGSLALSLGTNFVANGGSTCAGGLSLAPGASCYESFSFTPQGTGYLADSAAFSDNTLNLSPLVVLQTINLSGNGGLNGQAVGVAVPNVVGLAQAAATTTISGAGLAMGTVSTASSSIVPSGSVIAENPAAGAQVNPGSPVRLLVSTGQAPPQTPNPLLLENNYFVTGDYASAGVTLRGLGTGGMATGTITIPDSTTNPGVSQGVPDGADIIDAFLYWETLENTTSPSATSGTFDKYPITGQQIGSDLANYTDGTFTGTLRVYRADVNTYFPLGANGVRFASGAFSVSLPDSGGTGFPLTEGASLVVIYRVLSQNFPLKAVIIYDGSAIPTTSTTQNMLGFYDAVGGASGTGDLTALFAAGGSWNNSINSVSLGQSNQYNAPLNAGNAYGAVILSTPVLNSDNDGILDSWKAGPAAGDFYAGQPGYYDAKTGSWVPLPGAHHGEKDLFVQLDYMCGAVLSDGSCDPNQENLFPAPDAQGNDPLAMVQQAFAATGVALHLEIGNAVPESTCADNTSTTPPQLCQFPSEPGVIGWKNSLEFSKLWPRNLASCAAGGDCTTRFPYGQKDSYHYVLFGHSLAIPAWNSRYGTLTSMQVVSGVTTIVTADRGSGINACPSRITIAGVLGNPSLNGVYNTTVCADSTTITVATPGVPNWSYPNSTLPEPVIGLTSGTVTSISGYSDLGGADSAVTLGLWLTAANQDMSKRANVTAGTLFHEIGHTLGLSHGGLYYDTPGSYLPTFEANCKPNYQSVMNYLFQLDLVGLSQAVAYSNQQLDGEPQSGSPAILSQASLGSAYQLTDPSGNPATFSTSTWYTPTAPSSTSSPATMHCDGTPLTGDTGYRVEGPIAPITPAWSSGQNITFDGVPYTTLRGYNDWANIDLRQVGATGGEFASLATTLSFGSSASPLNIAAGGTVALGSGGTVALGSGGTVTLGSGGNVTLGSGGTITLGSGGNVTLGSGGNVTLGSGGTITPGSSGTVILGGGGNVTLSIGGTITLGSGGTVTLGSGGNVTLGSGGTIALGSGGSVTIPSTGGSYSIDSSGGTITLGSGGTVALGSGGNVTLGSGGTIALGSGGNVTLGSGGTVTLGSGGTIALGSGGNVTLGSGGNVTLGSGGTIALGSGGTITLGSGGNVTLGSGGTVTLGSGGDVSVGSGGNVTLGSGGSATLGSGGTVTLGSGGNVTLGSGGNVTLGSSGGTITLGSGGTVTLGSGGNVTLGSGGTIALGSGGSVTIAPGGSYDINSSGGTITLGSGGTVALGSGGTVTLGSGGTITLGSGGNITLGSGGTVTLGSGGNVTLGSGGVVALGSGGTVALGSGGTVALGSGGTITLGSGGADTNELTYETANSIVRPPSLPTETPMTAVSGAPVVVNWTAPIFGVVATYTISRSADGGTPIVIGSVSGVNGNPPATTFTDTNPDVGATTVAYTISTTLLPVPIDPTARQSVPSPPAVLTNNQTIVLGTLPSSVALGSSQPTVVTATAETNGAANGLQVSFSASGPCAIGSQSITNGVSSATVTLNSTGSCTITASQPGTNLTQPGNPPYYNAADSVSGTFMILPQGSNTQSQTISFASLQSVQYGKTFSLSASSSAGQPVSFTASGPCTTIGTTTGVGLCKITALAPGNSTYSAASLSQSFTIYPAVLTVTATTVTGTYGESSLPPLTYSFSPLVNGDPSTAVSGTPVLSTTATTASNAGNYPITVSTGTLAAANYSFLYVSGTLTIGKATATISISNIPASAVYGGNFSPTYLYSGNGSPTESAASNTTGVCTVSGGVVSFVGTGTCTLTASATATTDYSVAAGSPQSFTVAPATQTITFTQPASPVTYGVSSIPLSATATSGLTVAFSVDPASTGTGTIAGNLLTVTAAGTLVIDANQAGNTNYGLAPQVQRTIVVNKAAPTISISNIPTSAVYGGNFSPAYLYSGNGSPTESAASSTTGVCTVSGGVVSFIGVGTCTLTASATATTDDSAATGNPQSFTVAPATQTITFTQPTSPVTYGVSSIPLSATATSGLTVAFSVDPASTGTGTIAGSTLTVTGAGNLLIDAKQAGNTNYAAAPQVQRTIVVNKASQAITFTTNPPASAAYNSTFKVAATGGASGIAVTFTSSGVCSNSGATYTMTNSTGTCSVIANQAGNTNYSAAPQVTKTITATGPLVTVSPSNINFGTVTLGSITIKNITVTNIGTAPVTINDPLISIVQGGNSNEFVAVNLCPTPLTAGKNCTITIGFVAGPFYTQQTATLEIMDNAPGSPQPVTLSAVVIDPLASYSPASLAFGTVKHATSSTLNVTLTNTGATPLIFTGAGISVTGSNATDFVQSNNCGSSLAAGAKCTIAVKFTPATTGTFSANLTVVDNAQTGGGTQTVPLSGKGN